MAIKYSYILVESALKDLDNIAQYFHEIGMSGYGESLNNEFFNKILNACKEPLLYAERQTAKISKEKVRQIPVANFLIIYKVNKLEKTINVIRIVHQRQMPIKI